MHKDLVLSIATVIFQNCEGEVVGLRRANDIMGRIEPHDVLGVNKGASQDEVGLIVQLLELLSLRS